MAAEGDAQGQQTGCEHRGVIPVAGADVAHGPRRHAGRERDLADRRPPDSGRDDPPERVDVIEAAVQDALGKRATCPPAPPTAPARDLHQGALWSRPELPAVAAPPDQPAAAGPTAPSLRPGHLHHVAA